MNAITSISKLRPPKSSAVELYAKPSPDYARKLAHARLVLREAAELGHVTQANSLGVEDMVVSHLINALALPIPIFVLDTGRLHTETLALLERLQAHSRAPVQVFRPQPEAVQDYIRANGQDAIYQSIELRKSCCAIRKLEPLGRALAGKAGWITGLRREQSGARAQVPVVDRSEARIKFNPLADWTQGDVWHYVAEHGVDTNPLHDQFYPSIGCAPCTRAITLGEDIRAGRWWWESNDLKECGLHVKPHSAPAGAGDSRSEAPEGIASAQAHIAAGDVKATQWPGRSQTESAKECGLHVKT